MIREYINKYKEEIKKCINDLKHKDTFYKQIPNLLTFSRAIGMIPINILFLTGNVIPAIGLTGLILSTDFFDGKIARKYNIQSKFGADLDAVCDKVMFFGLSFPLLLNNPIMVVNFLLEGAIAFVNVMGRVKGIDTKTVYSGKVKTWFLSLMILSGYLGKFLFLSPFIFKSLIWMTIGSQLVAFSSYVKEYNNKIKEKSNSKIEPICNNNQELCMNKEYVSELYMLRREREFLLGCMEPEKIIVKKRIRYLEDEKKSN